MSCLFVAAEPRELRPLLERCRPAAREPLAVDWAWRGSLNGRPVLLVTNGAGRARAAAAVEAACSVFSPDMVISTGFCGALDPALAIGDLLAAREVAFGARRYPARLPGDSLRCSTGLVLTQDRVAQTATEKAALRAAGGDIVEMEAAGVAEQSALRGLPFCCVRAVTDLAGETFSNDFNAALREDGHFDTIDLLRAGLTRPAERIPELLRLRSRCVRAARILGEFFADCRL
jgi:adenosylhomocysteine nucleosidase